MSLRLTRATPMTRLTMTGLTTTGAVMSEAITTRNTTAETPRTVIGWATTGERIARVRMT